MNLILKLAGNNINKNFNLQFKTSFHYLTSTTNRHLFNKLTPKNVGSKFSKPKQNPNFHSNFLLFVRRIGKNSRLNTSEIPKRKVDPKELRRLIGLAKPEKYKIAGIYSIFFIINYCLNEYIEIDQFNRLFHLWLSVQIKIEIIVSNIRSTIYKKHGFNFSNKFKFSYI